MRSPLTPLASNELFARPLIVPHHACHSCCEARASYSVVVFQKAMRANYLIYVRPSDNTPIDGVMYHLKNESGDVLTPSPLSCAAI